MYGDISGDISGRVIREGAGNRGPGRAGGLWRLCFGSGPAVSGAGDVASARYGAISWGGALRCDAVLRVVSAEPLRRRLRGLQGGCAEESADNQRRNKCFARPAPGSLGICSKVRMEAGCSCVRNRLAHLESLGGIKSSMLITTPPRYCPSSWQTVHSSSV